MRSTAKRNGSSTPCRRSSRSASTRRSDFRCTIRTGTRSRMPISSGLATAEKPAFQRLQQLAARERLQVLGAAVALRDGDVVLERAVRGVERVVELVALKE